MGLKQPVYRELYNVVNKLRDLEIKGSLSSKSLKGLDKLIVYYLLNLIPPSRIIQQLTKF